jgi:hypothetical protein
MLPTLPLIKHHGTKMYGGMGIQLHDFFTLAVDGGEWSVGVRVTLQLTVSQSVRLGVQPHLRLVTRL